MDQFAAKVVTPANQQQTQVVSFAGAMTVEYGSQIKAAVVEAFAAETVVLDLTGVTEIDLFGLQCICSQHRTAIAQHKSYSVLGAERDVVQRAKEIAGFSRRIGCVEDVAHTCVWVGPRTEVPEHKAAA